MAVTAIVWYRCTVEVSYCPLRAYQEPACEVGDDLTSARLYVCQVEGEGDVGNEVL